MGFVNRENKDFYPFATKCAIRNLLAGWLHKCYTELNSPLSLLCRQLVLPLSLCDISLRPEGVRQRESH